MYPNTRIRLLDHVRPLAIAVTLGIIYGATLLEGVGFTGDTAKFQYIGKMLGIAHEPGYPIYTLLNHAWVSFVPFGSVAWRANLLSAVLATVACVLFYFAFAPRMRTSATVAAVCLGLSSQFWIHAVVAEVYSLVMVFVVLVTLGTFRSLESSSPRGVSLSALAAGIALGHHPLVVPVIVAMFIAVSVTRPILLRSWRLWGLLLLGGAIGLGSYSYILARSANPLTPHVEFEATTLEKLAFGLTEGRFRVRMFDASLRTVALERLPRILGELVRQIGPWALLVPLGARRAPRPHLLFIVVLVAGNLLVCANYGIPDLEPYLLSSVFGLMVLGAFGLEELVRLTGRRRLATWCLAIGLPLTGLALAGGDPLPPGARSAGPEALETLEAAGRSAIVWEPDYPKAHYLWYYLLAEGRQDSDSLFVVRPAMAAYIVGYLEGTRELRLHQQRRNAPNGLRVFVDSENRAEKLEDLGVAVTRVRGELFEVSLQPQR